MQNPFVYGEVVPAAAFVNRVAELDRLVGDLAASQKIFLISPRRYGKSSLIRHALAAMTRRGALTVEITVSSFSSYVAFLEGYARALVAAETKWDRARTWIRDAIRSARAEVRYAPDSSLGALTVSFPIVRTERDVSRLAQEVFELPARLADARKRQVVVALDEFQAINGFNGGSVEHALRAAVQHQRNVGYVFAGSEPTLMERMISPKRPFYKAGPVVRLEKIPADEFAAFIEARFTASGIKPEAGLGAAVVDLAGNLPYDVQRLAHETWDQVREGGRRRATLDDLHQALKRLLSEQQMMFEGVWQRLTLGQRAVAARRRPRRRPRAAVRRRAHAPSPRRPVDGAGGTRRADARRRHRAGPRSLCRGRLAGARVGRASDVFEHSAAGSVFATCQPIGDARRRADFTGVGQSAGATLASGRPAMPQQPGRARVQNALLTGRKLMPSSRRIFDVSYLGTRPTWLRKYEPTPVAWVNDSSRTMGCRSAESSGRRRQSVARVAVLCEQRDQAAHRQRVARTEITAVCRRPSPAPERAPRRRHERRQIPRSGSGFPDRCL